MKNTEGDIKMKIIINENERGFLFRNGTYCRMLSPGKYRVKRIFGETYARVNIAMPVALSNTDIAVLLRDKTFAKNVIRIDVPDGYIAIHMEDNRIAGALQPGTYCFWNCYREHTFKLVDISKSEINDLKPEQLMAIPCNLYSKSSSKRNRPIYSRSANCVRV